MSSNRWNIHGSNVHGWNIIGWNVDVLKSSWLNSLGLKLGVEDSRVEMFSNFQKGLLMSEVLEQRKEHKEISQQYKALCQTRDEHEEKQRLEIERDLYDKQLKR